MTRPVRRSLLLLAGGVAGSVPPAAHARSAAAARNAALVRRYFEEVWNRGRLEVLDGFCQHSRQA